VKFGIKRDEEYNFVRCVHRKMTRGGGGSVILPGESIASARMAGSREFSIALRRNLSEFSRMPAIVERVRDDRREWIFGMPSINSECERSAAASFR